MLLTLCVRRLRSTSGRQPFFSITISKNLLCHLVLFYIFPLPLWLRIRKTQLIIDEIHSNRSAAAAWRNTRNNLVFSVHRIWAQRIRAINFFLFFIWYDIEPTKIHIRNLMIGIQSSTQSCPICVDSLSNRFIIKINGDINSKNVMIPMHMQGNKEKKTRELNWIKTEREWSRRARQCVLRVTASRLPVYCAS